MTKPTKWHVPPVKTQISLGTRPVWSESSLSAWRKLGSWATHWAHSEDWSDWEYGPADLSLRWAHAHFTCFVLRWLICYTALYTVNFLFKVSGLFYMQLFFYISSCIYCKQSRSWSDSAASYRSLQYLSHVMRKPVFGVCDQVRLKQVYSATETY